MSGYKSFAFTGAGNIGKFLVEEFVNLKKAGIVDSVIVLTRTDSTTPIPDGAQAVRINYEDDASLTAALKGVDVVVSTIAFTGLATQHSLAKVAKAAGVKLFVPSEFGGDPRAHGGRSGPFAQKADFVDVLKELGLPYALFFTGLWPDFFLTTPFTGWDLPNGKVSLGGTGNVPISWTLRTDVARYMAHVLTALPSSKLMNKEFRIEGERNTLNGLIKEYQEKTGKTVEVSYRSASELEAELKANPANTVDFLYLLFESGGGAVGKPAEVDNSLFPEWNPKKALTPVL